MTLIDRVDNAGVCQRANYQEKGLTRDDFVTNAAITIRSSDYLAIAKMEEDKISLNGKVT